GQILVTASSLRSAAGVGAAAGAGVLMLTGLALAGSRSEWVAFGLVAVYAMVSAPGGMQRAAVASAAGTLGILGGAAAVDAFVRGGEARELATLTSRLPLWADLLGQAFPEEPLLGFGFQRIWYQEYFWSPGAYAASMAHNTFVQTLLGLGLAGLTVAGLQLGLTLAAAFRLRREPVGRSAWAILLPLLVNSWTEFGIFGPMNFATVLYQMVVILLALEDRPAWTGPAGTVREDAR
ncbi:MAG TPA: O-antigen ligase family protein, partial [Planctomycetota bacterium]|nr:O-antigen ligase family protein [Planctomycetota bacterium]